MSEFRQTNQFAEAVSSISGIVDTYLASKMKEAVDVAVQLQTNKLIEEAQAENQEFLSQVDSTMKFVTGDNDEQPADKEVTKGDWFKKPERPPTPDPDWNVYSRRRIIAVTRLKIMKMYDYGHLEEIEVRRDDQKLYTFKEGDFKRLRLQDIEDMLLLLVQQKLTNLIIDERNKTAYTSHSDPHGIIYVDQFKRKRLMRTDELYKFSDGMPYDVWTALHDIAGGIRMEYLPMRK
ncbi:hypothetical protein Tco_0132819 [Tanacetum coccineum]